MEKCNWKKKLYYVIKVSLVKLKFKHLLIHALIYLLNMAIMVAL